MINVGMFYSIALSFIPLDEANSNHCEIKILASLK